MSKPTPGPWEINRYHPSRYPFGISQVDAPFRSVITSGGFARKSTDEAEANARLIAAAPDLLAALEVFRECHEEGVLPSKKILEMAEAAIAKANAKGEA